MNTPLSSVLPSSWTSSEKATPDTTADHEPLNFYEHQQRVMEAAICIPPPADVAPENDLHPDPARLAFEVVQLRFQVRVLLDRVETLERRMSAKA